MGYWTVSALGDVLAKAWCIDRGGSLGVYDVTSKTIGVRPVITVLKSKIS